MREDVKKEEGRTRPSPFISYPPQYLVDDPQLIEKLNTKANRGGRESEIPKLFQIAQENKEKWIKAVIVTAHSTIQEP